MAFFSLADASAPRAEREGERGEEDGRLQEAGKTSFDRRKPKAVGVGGLEFTASQTQKP